MSDPRKGQSVITAVSALVDPAREEELISGFRSIVEQVRPAGLIRSELLRGQEGRWLIQTLWSDLETLRGLRAAGGRPAAQDLFDRVGAQLATHEVHFVVDSFGGDLLPPA
ncbi:MAG: hypothetical protein ACOYEV_00865 [Candidatus Nanopelagicales bacterium]